MVQRNTLKLTAKEQAARKKELIHWLSHGGTVQGYAHKIDRDVSSVRKFMKTHGIDLPERKKQ